MLRLHYNILVLSVLFIISTGQGYGDYLYNASGTEQEVTLPAEAIGKLDIMITAPDGYKVFLNITTINQSCCSSVKVLDKNNTSLGIFACRSGLNNLIVSNSEELIIQFAALQGGVCTEFRALYKRVSCGGTFVSGVKDPAKVQCSPTYPKNSDQSFDCTYLLYGEMHYRFQLYIDLITSGDDNYLEITNHDDERIQMQGNFLSKRTMSSSAALRLRYRTKNFNASTGFCVTFMLVQQPCDDQLEAGEVFQPIHTPGYPLSYPMHHHCTWTITPPEGFQVVLLLRRLDTEPKFASVEVFDGTVSLGQLSGSISTKIGFSSSAGKPLRVVFRSHTRYTQRRGFWAVFRQGHNCGREIVASQNGTVISTPGYPNLEYPKGLGCSWNIRAKKSMRVQVEVLDGETEACCDFVQILDGTSPMTKLHGRFDTPQTFLSSSNVMRVYFYSDKVTEKKGFIARVKEVCEHIFYATSVDQYMESPNYSTFSPHNLDCKYKFVAPSENSTIDITIVHMDTESCCDSLQIICSESSYAFSGHIEDLSLRTSKGTITFLYHTSSQVSSKGFQIRYKVP